METAQVFLLETLEDAIEVALNAEDLDNWPQQEDGSVGIATNIFASSGVVAMRYGVGVEGN